MEEIINVTQVDAMELQEANQRAEIDIQISTAKRFPRDVTRATDNALAIATMDNDTAQTCGYALPRAGKSIAGPSVHLARIIAAEWGNLRVDAKVVNITATQIVSQAVCFDLEKNYAVKVEVRKSIVGKHGRFKEDMVVVTGNAANAIAYRNAVFAVVPKGVVDKVYKASRAKLTGDLSDETKLVKRRKKVLDEYKDTFGVSEKEILESMGLNTINQIKQDEIVSLLALWQSLKDGDTTVDVYFNRNKNNKSVDDKKADMKAKGNDKEVNKTESAPKLDLP